MAAPHTPADSPLTLDEVMASPAFLELRTPLLAVGEPAFPFDLPRLDPGSHRPTAERVRLADFTGRRPVALVFGSYTWPPFRRQLRELERLHDLHKAEVAFFVVYIREAHPEDGWVLTANREEKIALADPTSLDERAAAAEACVLRLRTRIPVLLDDVDDAVALAYGGWPDRLYLIGRDGRVAFQGDEGPSGFKPQELERAIEAELVVHRRLPQDDLPPELLDPPPEAHQSNR